MLVVGGVVGLAAEAQARPAFTENQTSVGVLGQYGVDLEYIPELDGAKKVWMRFEDVSFTSFPGGTGNYAVLAGGGYTQWWVGVDYDLPPYGANTSLQFNVGGWGNDGRPFFEHAVPVASEVITHFDSIEYRFDGTASPEERLGIRFNDGPWVVGGWSNPEGSPPSRQRTRSA